MPENELLDEIDRAFKEYNYWSMKALKSRIPQPEVYLRATLEKLADLNKTGRFANQWSLKEEFRRPRAAQELAPEPKLEAGEDDDEDEEDVKMEDVV